MPSAPNIRASALLQGWPRGWATGLCYKHISSPQQGCIYICRELGGVSEAPQGVPDIKQIKQIRGSVGTSKQPLGLRAAIHLGLSSASGKFGGIHQYSCWENLIYQKWLRLLSTYVHRPCKVILYLLLFKIIAIIDFPLYNSFWALLGVWMHSSSWFLSQVDSCMLMILILEVRKIEIPILQ